jgi:cytochrome c biogenesis protein ResB
MRRVVRFLASIKLGIGLIAAVAIACVCGSLIAADPQQGVDRAIARVFAAPWFVVLVAMLALNLVLCSWEKTAQAFALPWRGDFADSPEFFQRLDAAAAVERPVSADQLEQILRRHFCLVRRRGNSLYAQKGLISRWGATVIHLGLLTVIGAAVVRSLSAALGWGIYDATVIAAEGETATHYYTREDRLAPASADNLRPHPLPFPLRVLDFTAEKYPGSAVVRTFRCLVEAGEGAEARIAEVSMAQPLFYRGIKITLSSYDEHPWRMRDVYEVRDNATGASVEIDAQAGDPVRLPLPNRSENLFFEVGRAGTTYRILDLDRQRIVEEGDLDAAPQSASVVHQADKLTSLVKSLPLAIVLFGHETAGDPHSGASWRAPTTSDTVASVLVAFFARGTLADQKWLTAGAAPTPLGSDFLAQFSTSGNSHSQPAPRDGGGELFVMRRDSPQTSSAITVDAADVVELRSAEGALSLVPHAMRFGGAIGESGTTGVESTATAAPPRIAGTARFAVRRNGAVPACTVYLGIMRDPALPWFYAGCLLIFGGMVLAFAFTHRQEWFWYDPSTNRLYGGLEFYRRGSQRAVAEFWRIVTEAAASSAGNIMEEGRPRECHGTERTHLP